MEDEAENFERMGEIVKFVEIRYGINEDGGGIQIVVRDDEADTRTLVDLALMIFERINGRRGKEEVRNEVI